MQNDLRPALIMHVNYCEQGQSLEEMCRKAVDWGFDGIEFRRKRSGVQETTTEYLDALEKAVASSGLKEVIFGHPGVDFMDPDPAKHREEIEAAKSFFREAHERFGTTICNTFSGDLWQDPAVAPHAHFELQGSACSTEAQWQAATEGFKEIGAAAAEMGMKLGFETHPGYLHDIVEPTIRLIDAIGSPAVGATLDLGNIIHFPNAPTPTQLVEQMGERTFYVHLKNSLVLGDHKYIQTPLADGQINNREFLRALKEANFTGPLCIEAPRAGDREWFVQQDLAYLKTVLDGLGWN